MKIERICRSVDFIGGIFFWEFVLRLIGFFLFFISVLWEILVLIVFVSLVVNFLLFIIIMDLVFKNIECEFKLKELIVFKCWL